MYTPCMILRSPSDPNGSYLAYYQDRVTTSRQMGENALCTSNPVPDRLGSRVQAHADSVPNDIYLLIAPQLRAFVISKLAVRLHSLSVVTLLFWLAQSFFFSRLVRSSHHSFVLSVFRLIFPSHFFIHQNTESSQLPYLRFFVHR